MSFENMLFELIFFVLSIAVVSAVLPYEFWIRFFSFKDEE